MMVLISHLQEQKKKDYQRLESYIDFFEIYKDMNKNDPKDSYFENVGISQLLKESQNQAGFELGVCGYPS